jgi:hypothetical protein
MLIELLHHYVPPAPKKPHHRILESGRALVKFEIDCIIINEENELYGGGEVDTNKLCEEDRKHVSEQARSISSAYEVDHTPVFAVSKRVVHFICLEAGDCA